MASRDAADAEVALASVDEGDMRTIPATARAALGYLAISLVLGLTVWSSSAHLPHWEEGLRPRSTTLAHGDAILGPWLYWDTKYYVGITEHGYTQEDVAIFDREGPSAVAFFPGYPLLARGVRVVVGSTGLALILVTFLSGLALVPLVYSWFQSRLGSRAAAWALASMLLFPWSYFLVATAYSEALFLLCAVGAFVLVERDRPIAAGLVGALAAATRSIGIGVIIGLALRVAERRGALSFDGWRPHLDRSRLRPGDAGVLLAVIGLVAWIVFCWARFGDPLAFSTAQRGWSQGFGPHSWFKLGFIDQLFHNGDRFWVLRLGLQGIVLTLFCLTIPAVWRRFGAGYGAYTLVALGFPMLGSAYFASNGRFSLMAFPTFALIGERLAKERRRDALAVLGLSGALLLVVVSFWGRGYWMA